MITDINKNKLYEDFLDASQHDEVIIPDEQVEPEAEMRPQDYDHMFTLYFSMREVDSLEDAMNGFKKSFKMISRLLRTMPYITKHSNIEYALPENVKEYFRRGLRSDFKANITFYVNLKKMSVRQGLQFFASLFNAVNLSFGGLADVCDQIEFYPKSEDGNFRDDMIYDVKLVEFVNIFKKAGIDICYYKRKITNDKRNMMMQAYNCLQPFMRSDYFYWELIDILDFDYREFLTNKIFEARSMPGQQITLENVQIVKLPVDVMDGFSSGEFDVEEMISRKTSYMFSYLDQQYFENSYLGYDAADSKALGNFLRSGMLKPSEVRIYYAPQSEEIICIVYVAPTIVDYYGEKRLFSVAFDFCQGKNAAPEKQIPGFLTMIFQTSNLEVLKSITAVKSAFERFNKIHESLLESLVVNEDFINDVDKGELVVSQIQEEQHSPEEYEHIMVVELNYSTNDAEVLSQNIRKLKRQFDRFMKMSPMVRDFCGAEFYTDKFEIYRNSNNFVKLKEDEEYLKYVRRGYTALVCGFDARQEPSPKVVMKFLSGIITNSTVYDYKGYNITFMSPERMARTYSCPSSIINEVVTAMFRSYESENKVRIESLRSVARIATAFNKSPEFLYQLQDAIPGCHNMFQKSMEYKMYFVADQTIEDGQPLSRAFSDADAVVADLKISGDSFVYADSNFVIDVLSDTSKIRRINDNSESFKRLKQRMNMEPIVPDLVTVYNTSRIEPNGHEDGVVIVVPKIIYDDELDEFLIYAFSVYLDYSDVQSDSELELAGKTISRVWKTSEKEGIDIAHKLYNEFI